MKKVNFQCDTNIYDYPCGDPHFTEFRNSNELVALLYTPDDKRRCPTLYVSYDYWSHRYAIARQHNLPY